MFYAVLVTGTHANRGPRPSFNTHRGESNELLFHSLRILGGRGSDLRTKHTCQFVGGVGGPWALSGWTCGPRRRAQRFPRGRSSQEISLHLPWGGLWSASERSSVEGRGLKPQSSVSRRDGVRSYLLNLGKGQVRCALSSCGDWSPRLSLAALLLSQGHQGGSHVWRRVLVVRWHRAVGRQGPLGVMLEQSPAEYPHAQVGVSVSALVLIPSKWR